MLQFSLNILYILYIFLSFERNFEHRVMGICLRIHDIKTSASQIHEG